MIDDLWRTRPMIGNGARIDLPSHCHTLNKFLFPVNWINTFVLYFFPRLPSARCGLDTWEKGTESRRWLIHDRHDDECRPINSRCLIPPTVITISIEMPQIKTVSFGGISLAVLREFPFHHLCTLSWLDQTSLQNHNLAYGFLNIRNLKMASD